HTGKPTQTGFMAATFPSLPQFTIPGPAGDRVFRPPLVMGILNITPDSFSDGGAHAGTTPASPLNLEPADRHPHAMLADGADLIGIGGESTRPGAAAVTFEAEIARTVPVITALRERGETAPISIDTMKAAVARAALDAGANIVNDVTAAAHDP